MSKGRLSKKNIYKYLFLILVLLNISFFVYLAVKHPRFYVFFEKQIEIIFDNQKAPIGNYLSGIDVSEYQGIINWGKLKSNQKKRFIVIFGC